ncbi:hypothetical protein Zmor_004905 [Zophobas morio]|uniref:J domain-containing protein n=1 Tax=Zophobas morio TaxID=2755281 RepID=A0AA38ML14_9CUCU|nr:hypothetical protein Zmor_004905 [Zophobas morio]
MTTDYSRCTPIQQKEVNRINKSDDHYEILGVKETATKPEIEQASRKLSLKVHPDKCNCAGAEDAFKKMGNTKRVLVDRFESNSGGINEARNRPQPWWCTIS